MDNEFEIITIMFDLYAYRYVDFNNEPGNVLIHTVTHTSLIKSLIVWPMSSDLKKVDQNTCLVFDIQFLCVLAGEFVTDLRVGLFTGCQRARTHSQLFTSGSQ